MFSLNIVGLKFDGKGTRIIVAPDAGAARKALKSLKIIRIFLVFFVPGYKSRNQSDGKIKIYVFGW
jgi:hypothetical protein